MMTRAPVDERQRRLLILLASLVGPHPCVDTTRAVAVYTQLRVDLLAAGATDNDFACLTERLIGLVIEHGSPGTSHATWRAVLNVISSRFACRDFSVLVERGVVVAVDFAAPPTTH